MKSGKERDKKRSRMKTGTEQDTIVVFDAGARNGFREIPQLHSRTALHCFEPEPGSFSELQKMYAEHDFRSVRLSSSALSARPGKALLHRAKNAGMSSLLEANPESYDRNFSLIEGGENWKNSILPVDSIEITCTTIDAYMEQEKPGRIDFLKLDTQGTELFILQGAIETIRRKKISVIKTEVMLTDIYKGQCFFSDIDIFLRGQGYQLVDCDFYTDVKARDLVVSSKNRVREKPKSGPSGDAFYVLNFAGYEAPGKQVLHAAEILAALGFYSNAAHLYRSLPGKTEAGALDFVRPFAQQSFGKRTRQFIKKFIPPVFRQWYRQLKKTNR
ncbi:MAG: FkbM family methyltransferase [Bacteroidetes bacterium]|nr:MAG: FkbM family methyltransferase [Bacteroidota bacterium]